MSDDLAREITEGYAQRARRSELRRKSKIEKAIVRRIILNQNKLRNLKMICEKLSAKQKKLDSGSLGFIWCSWRIKKKQREIEKLVSITPGARFR
jgi:hypothetical protein